MYFYLYKNNNSEIKKYCKQINLNKKILNKYSEQI